MEAAAARVNPIARTLAHAGMRTHALAFRPRPRRLHSGATLAVLVLSIVMRGLLLPPTGDQCDQDRSVTCVLGAKGRV